MTTPGAGRSATRGRQASPQQRAQNGPATGASYRRSGGGKRTARPHRRLFGDDDIRISHHLGAI